MDNARRYARLCLDASQGEDVPKFYLGYAYEALARAESLGGNTAQMEQYLNQARNIAAAISDSDEKQMLLDDLAAIG